MCSLVGIIATSVPQFAALGEFCLGSLKLPTVRCRLLAQAYRLQQQITQAVLSVPIDNTAETTVGKRLLEVLRL